MLDAECWGESRGGVPPLDARRGRAPFGGRPLCFPEALLFQVLNELLDSPFLRRPAGHSQRCEEVLFLWRRDHRGTGDVAPYQLEELCGRQVYDPVLAQRAQPVVAVLGLVTVALADRGLRDHAARPNRVPVRTLHLGAPFQVVMAPLPSLSNGGTICVPAVGRHSLAVARHICSGAGIQEVE